MISIKIHRSYRSVVAVCDVSLLGKKFEEGKRQLDLKESFYKDKEVSLEDAIKIMQFQAREDATFNIVGEESIKAAIEAGVIAEKQVDKISEIPFALTLV